MKSVLAIDGGGLRGLISLGFLARIEEVAGAPLSARFDVLGGTSGGALISTALALGQSVEEVRGFYTDLAPWRLPSFAVAAAGPACAVRRGAARAPYRGDLRGAAARQSGATHGPRAHAQAARHRHDLDRQQQSGLSASGSRR
jgi:predicted acylesterase/phospholipase RssA